MIIPLSDVADLRLEDYRGVPDPELLRVRGAFIAEGRLVVRRLLETPRFRTRSVLLTPPAREALADLLDARPDLPVYLVAPDAMNAIAGFNIHRGCLAVGERPPAADWMEVVAGASRVVVLERVSNPDNVGGIFRSAAALGTDAVLLGPSCADPLYRKTIRTSMGASLRVPFAAMTAWPGDLLRLRAAGFRLVALTPATNAVPMRGLALPARVALMVGHEGDGLSAAALEAADQHARIPMAGEVDSLNVAAAASIALYELSARETRSGSGDRRSGGRRGTDPASHRTER